ncbi:MAG: serine/threonine protein kinase/Tfp pilus assembly protein PilF [Chlamydiales bacterium]|jgi:serine/threonine protein kinase/Tfp pilus assembly protein PilF
MPGSEPTRFAQVRALFEGALDLVPEERRAYIEHAARDAGARTEALDLLSELEDGACDLPVPDVRALASCMEPEPGMPESGARIAGYQILRTIGEGGMGRVFEARASSPERRVALKMMRTGLGTAASQRRFEVEAEVLARLLHPGVAQVYVSGLWHDPERADAPPRPWFAMEFVPGARSLLDHVRSSGCDLRQRMNLFLELCDAVEHAHQRGVIHRDLKSANVLVDRDGRVKVIDFGIARVEGSQTDSLRTREGEVLGTLATMSPEQALGQWTEVDVRTDVYALGVLLYELAAGRPPYDLKGLSLPSALRVVCEDPPTRPGVRTADRTGDLDWIALRALEKERTRRYANVPELAADVRRFLAHEPVLAGPPTVRYRAAKFLRRHRLAVSAAVLVLTSLIAGIVIASTERTRAILAAAESRRDADHAAFINAFLLDTLAAPDPWVSGPNVRVLDRLDATLDSIRADLQQRPELRASLLAALGRTYSGLSLYDRSETVLSEALTLLGSQLGRSNQRTLKVRLDRTDALLGLARYDDAALEARAIIKEARVGGLADGDLTFVARDYEIQALGGQGRLDAALEAARGLESDSEAAFGPDHEQTVSARRTLADVHAERGEVLEAEQLARACLESLRRVHAEDHPDVLRAERSLATQLLSRRQYDEAQTLLEDALERSGKRFGEEHKSTMATRIELTVLHVHRRNLDRADQLSERALTQARRQLEPDHPLLMQAIAARADVLVLQGNHAEAEELQLEQLAVQRRRLPAVHAQRAEAENGYATLLYEIGRWAEAEQGYRRAIAAAPPGSQFVALSALHGLGVTLLSLGRADEAAAELESCMAARIELSGPDNDGVLDTRTMLSRAYLERGDLDRARELADATVAGRILVHGPDALKTAEAHNNLAVVQQKQGEYRAAEATTRQVLVIFRDRLGDAHPSTVRAYNNLGLSLHYQGRFGEALDIYLEGLTHGIEGLGEAHPAVARLYMNMAELHLGTGAAEEALLLFETLIENETERDSPASLNARYGMSGRGRALKALGRMAEADEQIEVTLEVLRDALGDGHWESLRAALAAVRSRRARGEIAEAAELASESALNARSVLPQAGDLHPMLELEAGELLLELGNPEAARDHLVRARDTWLTIGNEQPALLKRAERGLERLTTGADTRE